MTGNTEYAQAAKLIAKAKRLSAFTGAGISVESGVPPFRGKGGLWETHDPHFIEIDYFLSHPLRSWRLIKEIFYDTLGKAQPNNAHRILAKWNATVVTQNIDNLHTLAGSERVYEFHGAWRELLCLDCYERYQASEALLATLPPRCTQCGGLLKPDFVFFGEMIPEAAHHGAFSTAGKTDVMVVVGTTGGVMPACMVPYYAKRNGAVIIEVNPQPSALTDQIVDIFLQDNATTALRRLDSLIP